MQRRNFLTLAAALAGFPLSSRAESSLAAGSAPEPGAAVWSSAAAIPRQVQELYTAVHQQKLYVAGGIGARLGVTYFTNEVSTYDPTTDSWSEVAELPEDLHHIALVSDGNNLYGMGGFNGGYTHVWRMRDAVYRLEDDRWNQVATLPTRQAEGVVTHHNNLIHVVTGQQPKGEANSARSDHTEGHLHWIWDGNTWRDLAPIPTARNSATGGWIDDQLIIAGGRTARGNLSVTEIYDAKADTWRTAAPMPLPQAGTASVVVDQSLIVFGGEIFRPEAKVFPNVWRYDLATDQWSALPNMLTPRHGLGAGLIDDRIFVVGGATEPGGSGTSDLNEVLTL